MKPRQITYTNPENRKYASNPYHETDIKVEDPMAASVSPFSRVTKLAASFTGDCPINVLQIRNIAGPGLMPGYSMDPSRYGAKGNRKDAVFESFHPYEQFTRRNPHEDADKVLERIQQAAADMLVHNRNKTQVLFTKNWDAQHVTRRLSEKQMITQSI